MQILSWVFWGVDGNTKIGMISFSFFLFQETILHSIVKPFSYKFDRERKTDSSHTKLKSLYKFHSRNFLKCGDEATQFDYYIYSIKLYN